jgi:hypothetical protein
MVSGISGGRGSDGGVGSKITVVAAILGRAVVVGAKSDGGADGAASIDPVGGFFLGFGRGFFMATSGSACAPPLDVEATALSAISVVVARADCGGFVVFRSGKKSGTLRVEIGGKMEVESGPFERKRCSSSSESATRSARVISGVGGGAWASQSSNCDT